MWDNLDSIFGDGTSSNMENDKKINKKKDLQCQEYQPQESHPISANDSADDEKKPESHEPKGININDFILTWNSNDLDFDHVEVPSEDENDINVLRDNISRLTISSKDQANLLKICDDKEAKIKEEIVSLKIKLAKLEKFEEGMRK